MNFEIRISFSLHYIDNVCGAKFWLFYIPYCKFNFRTFWGENHGLVSVIRIPGDAGNDIYSI